MWPWKRRQQAPPKPDYARIVYLEWELGMRARLDDVTDAQEQWFAYCREVRVARQKNSQATGR